jgi:hypothetical protein
MVKAQSLRHADKALQQVVAHRSQKSWRLELIGCQCAADVVCAAQPLLPKWSTCSHNSCKWL